MRVPINQDLLAGLLLTGTGIAFAIGSLDFRLGTPLSMGPGFFPLAVSLLLVVLGVLSLIPAFKGGAGLPAFDLRQLLVVSTALLVFALMIVPFGLLPSVVAVVLVGAFADRRSRVLQTLALAGGVCFGVWLVFLLGLGLNIPAYRLPW